MSFLENFSPDRVFLVITHCDVHPDAVTEEHVAGKLESLKTFAGLDIPRDNVILSDNTIESIQPIFDRLSHGEMKFLPKDQLLLKGKLMQNELPKVFQVQDEKDGSNNASQFEFIIDMMKDQQAKMVKQMD
jgi:hypothetical protein